MISKTYKYKCPNCEADCCYYEDDHFIFDDYKAQCLYCSEYTYPKMDLLKKEVLNEEALPWD